MLGIVQLTSTRGLPELTWDQQQQLSCDHLTTSLRVGHFAIRARRDNTRPNAVDIASAALDPDEGRIW